MAETKKQYFMKPKHGRIYVKGVLVVGEVFERNEKTKKLVAKRVPLTDAQVALFSKEQKEQYLEQK